MNNYITVWFVFLSISYISFLQCYSYEYTIDNTKAMDKKQYSNEGTQGPCWVDPFDMSGGDDYPNEMCKSPPNDNLYIDPLKIGWKDSYQEERDRYFKSKRQDSSNSEKFIIYQRFINIFLKALALQDTPEIIGSKQVQLDLGISGHDFKLLKEFGSLGEKAASIERVSETINKIFLQSKLKSTSFEAKLYQIFDWLCKTALKVVSSPEWTITTSLLSMMVVVLWLVFVTGSYRLALFCTFFMIFIGGYGFHWMRMYEEREVERFHDSLIHGDAPYHCKGHSLNWYQTVYYFWFGEDCLQFYKRRDVRPIVKVSPTEVLSVTLSSMIIEPAQNIGKAYGNFVDGIINNVPWYLTPIAVPLAFSMPLLFFIVIVAFFLNYQLSFSLTGFHFFPSWPSPIVYKQDNKYIEDLSHRANKSEGLFENILSNCKKPVYVLMDLSAVKSVFSNFPDGNMIGENNSDQATTKHPDEEKVQSSKEEISKGGCDNCKKRTKSIYTSASGSSLGISDSQISGESLKVMSDCAGDHKSCQEVESGFDRDSQIKEK